MEALDNSSAQREAAQWLDEHGDALFTFALRHVQNVHAAEDLVQETLLAAMRGRQSYRARASARGWLMGILKHKIVDHIRKASRQRPLSAEALEQWADAQFTRSGKWKSKPARWGAFESDVENAELSRTLSECLERLPTRAAQALLMAELQHKTAEALSRIFEVSTINIGVILYRARLAMRHCLEVKWFGRRKEGSP